MESTDRQPDLPSLADWRAAGLLYYSRNFFNRQQFGERAWRISVDGGFCCPNRDGTCGTTGCVFCDPASFSPSRRLAGRSITEQIDTTIARLVRRRKVGRFLAYFQPATNTYAEVERLEAAYEEALRHPQIVGLSVGTRPDCVGPEVLDLLERLARRTWLSVEYGLQTIHDRTLTWIRRGHDYAAFVDAVTRSRGRGFDIGAHVILGLPGESGEDMLATARALADLHIDSVKVHNIHVVRNTPLAEMAARGEVVLPTLPEYVAMVVGFLELLPPTCVVDRLSGEAPPEYLLGPAWCADKTAVRNAIEAEMRRRNTWQGRCCEVCY